MVSSIPISSMRRAVEGGILESVMIWSMSSISAILLKPRRPNLEESASTIVFVRFASSRG